MQGGPVAVLWVLSQLGKRGAKTPPWPGEKAAPPTPTRTPGGEVIFNPPHATGLKHRPRGVPPDATQIAPGVYQAPAYATPSGMKKVGPGSFEMPETYITAKQPTLRQGMTGPNVKILQQKLGQKMDGVFGPATKGAVVAFQIQHHLSPDGVVGSDTWDALLGGSPAPATTQAAPSAAERLTAQQSAAAHQAAPSKAPASTLRQGSKGASVQLLQALLKTAGFPELTVDSNFGPSTTAAVKAFQHAHGLKVDGVVGPKTWAALGY